MVIQSALISAVQLQPPAEAFRFPVPGPPVAVKEARTSDSVCRQPALPVVTRHAPRPLVKAYRLVTPLLVLKASETVMALLNPVFSIAQFAPLSVVTKIP